LDRLQGKVAVVTGGSRGIGRAVALRLADEGADVVVNYHRDGESAAAVVRELAERGRRAFAVQADVSDPEQSGRLMDEAVERFGGLHILVSNAGIEHFAPLAEITPADFDRVFATNTRGQLFATQHAARHLGEGGRILLTSSVSAGKAVFHHALYAGSKAAVEAIARNLAPELAQRGITINAIAPGGTWTDMALTAAPHYRHPESTLDTQTQLRTFAALGRAAEPGEIAAAVAFLVSPDASYVTGSTIPVHGGYF
jgi:3-oxoacyl-[acyl-carrier protein] reductase